MGSQTGTDGKEGNSLTLVEINGPQGESKLEFFGFDSLVNILGLKRYSVFICLCSSPENSLYLLNASMRGPLT